MSDSRRFSVYFAFGGGAVADVLLWKKWCGSISLLVGSTALWFLFERAGYNLLSFISNVLLLLIAILFFWAKFASLLNRPLPPLPNLEISEEIAIKTADEMRVWVNYVFSIAHDIAIGGNLRLFIQVALSSWFISCIGGFFNFLTLLYVGILLSLSLPLVYEKYQNQIDDRLTVAHNIIQTQYRKIDDRVSRKISTPADKDKKIQ